MMKRPVIKVARRGFDVRTADPRHLTLDSSKNQLKIVMQVKIILDEER